MIVLVISYCTELFFCGENVVITSYIAVFMIVFVTYCQGRACYLLLYSMFFWHVNVVISVGIAMFTTLLVCCC